jgi:hypothetical protein
MGIKTKVTMSNYDNTNTGILFKNDVGDNPKRPAYKGKIDIDGKEYQLAGWLREGKSGKFISLKVDDKAAAKSTKDEQDEIPF